MAAGNLLKNVLHEVTDLDSKVFATFKALLLRPGLLTTEYLAGRRGRYLSPVKLYLIVSAVYFLFAWDASLEIANFEQKLAASPLIQGLPLPPNLDRGIFLQQWFEKAGDYSAYFRFVSVLGLALALAVICYSAARYFGQHLIFAFHYYSFDFCLYAFLILLLVIFQLITGLRAPAWVLTAGTATLPFYLFFALRRAYAETATAAALKALALLACDVVLTLIGDALALGLSALVVFLKLK
ncbi:MAG: DUF3667 domain-containing protein [Acidobacteriota bacterium]|nr:DUF3667 domain-containing protein [Acidobacteriota bacterium]